MDYISTTERKILKKFYNIDINLTESCNLSCTYCIIDFNKLHLKPIDPVILEKILSKVDYLLESEEFLKVYGGVRLSFWGGEPTTNFKDVKLISERYKDDNRVKYFMYSNGFDYKHVFDYLEKFKNEKAIDNDYKFLTQISYDGLASHDIDRLDLKGKGSALRVKENIFELQRRKIPLSVHSTIAAKNFNKIADNYFEFKRISNTLNFEMSYSPTIDYMSKYNFTKKELEELTCILKEQFLRIKDSEIEYYKQNGYFSFGWFNPNRAICTAGDSYCGIDIDGKVYACHGVFNESYKDKAILNDIDFSNMKFTTTLLDTSKKYNKILKEAPEECKECFTHYCLKCNSTKTSISKKETLEERWTDYNNQPGLCHIFKFIGKFRIALMRCIDSSKY